ncbi:MAG: hypothetical protein QM728_04225 [Gordonia sp. (in: high G+C Gram-positive bacteria)]|uniref:hypothetical protein n=1 Tax=Gordonia sp. (in: high G+C Gram-positive bacteria) TaxID=84139 RepID=UPI0039E63C34
MTPAARALGVDLDRVAADVAVLSAVGAGLADELAAAGSIRDRAADGLGGPVEGPMSVLADLPDLLRADLTALAHIREAADAAWRGLGAVCAKVAAVTGDVEAADQGADEADVVDAVRGRQTVLAAGAGVDRMDEALAELDGELVLIGGR